MAYCGDTVVIHTSMHHHAQPVPQHTRRATVVEGHGFRALRRSSTSTRRRVEEPRAEGGGCSDEIEGVEEMEGVEHNSISAQHFYG